MEWRQPAPRVTDCSLCASLAPERGGDACPDLIPRQGNAFQPGRLEAMTTAMDPTSGARTSMRRKTTTSFSRRPAACSIRSREYDACGVGFIADLKGRKSHQHRQGRALHPGEPRAPRRGRRRPHRRRRRRHPDPDPARVPERGVRQARHQAAQARPLRRRPHLHAAGRAAARALRARLDAHHPRGGPGVPGLALGAGRQHLPVRHGEGDRAGAPADLHRPAEVDARPGRVRAQALPDPQGRLQRHLRRLQGPRHRPLHGVAVEPHAGLQGHVPVLSGEGLLRGPVRPSGWPRRWRWCTSASPPTPSRRGSWRIPIAWSPTTARSTRCAATSTGWRRGRRRSPRRCTATTSPSCGRSPTRASPTRPASTTRSSSW